MTRQLRMAGSGQRKMPSGTTSRRPTTSTRIAVSTGAEWADGLPLASSARNELLVGIGYAGLEPPETTPAASDDRRSTDRARSRAPAGSHPFRRSAQPAPEL